MLQIKNLSMYHTKDLTPLVEHLSFSLKDGEHAALIGEEGNGKSTLLRLIAEQEVPYVTHEGEIIVSGARGFLPQELPEAAHELPAYAFFAESSLFYDQTPRELADLARELSLPADVFYSEQTIARFSGDERIKLQLARLLMEKTVAAAAGRAHAQPLAALWSGGVAAFRRLTRLHRRRFPRQAICKSSVYPADGTCRVGTHPFLLTFFDRI